MIKLKTVLAVALCVLACAAMAQDTNTVKTQLGLFDARIGVVLVKGIGPVGSIPLGATQLAIGYKQTKDLNTGEKAHGAIIEVEGNVFGREAILVDDDELDSLVNAVSYLAKINNNITTLTGFEASYTTKAGLRVIAESIRRDGGVQIYLKFEGYPRFPLSPVQTTQLSALLQQCRKNLDAVKSGN
jgi:hypothetical protein